MQKNVLNTDLTGKVAVVTGVSIPRKTEHLDRSS